ncbi:MAG: hypothetical protein P4L79_17795 [Legionella sp.]|uniref:hypothetical protein n=1 Tax=Legionella sp. TaxID=459 RepID=UPI00284EA2AD|nr:hypothetical protein [Legionella sp.]
MRLISFLFLFSVQLISNTVSAATLEFDVANIFPQQNLIQTVKIEAESLQAEMTLNNGQILDPLATSSWPSFSEITQVLVQGPEVQFKVLTKNGSEWTRSLGSFDLKFLNIVNANRREMSLDLQAIPLDKVFEQKNTKKAASLSYYLFKTLMLIAKGNVHVNLLISTDLEKNAHPLMKINYELNKQSLDFELQEQPNELTSGTWKIYSNGLGKNSLVDLVIKALRTMSEEYKNLKEKTEYDQLLQKAFYGMELFLDFTAPISEWTGIGLTIQGSFDYLSNSSVFSTHINNYVQLDAYNGSWSTSFGSKSYFSLGIADSPMWSQEFNLKNPANDLQKIAEWVQLNGSKQLAELINMPSIKYYTDYFPKYFIQGLTVVMSSLGENQEDKTMSFKFIGNSDGSFTIGGLNTSEVSSLIIAKIKEKMGGWYAVS